MNEREANNERKMKRMRINPVKKWTKDEERALITFLLENRDFEKPTAQVYYRRFAKVSNIAVDWKITRSKVRNMRTSYSKAKEWRSSAGASSMEGDDLITNLIKMCHFFYAFDDIFGGKQNEKPVVVESWLSTSSNFVFDSVEVKSEEITCSENESLPSTSSKIIPSTTAVPDIRQFQREMLSLEKHNSIEVNSKQVTCSENESLPSPSNKKIPHTTAVLDVIQYQGEMLSLKKYKYDQELVLRKREVEIKEQELKLKERELELKERELELKEKELKSQEKLKILELEMKERLAMEELKMKYK